MEIHKANAVKVVEDLMEILCAMPSWSWDDYVAKVRAKGYTLKERLDKDDGIKGYTIGKTEEPDSKHQNLARGANSWHQRLKIHG